MQTRPPLTTSLLVLSLGRVLPRRPPRPVRCNPPLPSPPTALFITSLRLARVVASSSLSASSRRDYATTSKPKTPKPHKKATPAGPSTKRPEARAWRPSSLPEDVGVILSEGQQKVLELVLRGKNVFLSGSAGTGKSLLLRKIISKFREDRFISPSHVAVTSTTGASAVNLAGGQTLHSWAGLGIRSEDAVAKSLNDNARLRWRQVQILVIDEVSMLDGALFNALDQLAQEIREDNRPFGGIQLVLVGDFFQLPPIGERDSEGRTIPADFIFQTESWKALDPVPVRLTEVFRQKDKELITVLNECRVGKLSPKTVSTLKGLRRPVTYPDGIYTSLYPVLRQVDEVNIKKLRDLPGQQHDYPAFDFHRKTDALETAEEVYSQSFDDAPLQPFSRKRNISKLALPKLLASVSAPKLLSLKKDSTVMLLRNDPYHSSTGLINGSLGRVVDFMTYKRAEFKDIGRFSAWMSADAEQRLEEDGREYPVVQFVDSGAKKLIPPVFFDVSVGGEMAASRIQLPLTLAWALSIHKAQGKTLSRVRIDLRHIFVRGQAYTALSRCTSMETLQIENFDPAKVVAHPDVIRWNASAKFIDALDL